MDESGQFQLQVAAARFGDGEEGVGLYLEVKPEPPEYGGRLPLFVPGREADALMRHCSAQTDGDMVGQRVRVTTDGGLRYAGPVEGLVDNWIKRRKQ